MREDKPNVGVCGIPELYDNKLPSTNIGDEKKRRGRAGLEDSEPS